MKETRVASRYAKALFDLALEMNLLDQIMEDIRIVSDVCNQNHEFVLLLRSPVVKERKKITIIGEIFTGRVHRMTLQYMTIITRNRREGLIMEIANQFINLYKKYKNILPVTLITAVKLDTSTRDRIVALINDRAQANIELTERTDESVIGGFVMEFDQMQYDASVLRKIKNLEKEFDINLYIKGF